MRLVAIALFLVGCKNPDQVLLDDWSGIYEITRHQYNDEGCEEPGPELQEPTHVELDGAAGIDAHLVEIRRCPDPETCEGAGWATALTDEISDKRMFGTLDDWAYFSGDFEGRCEAMHSKMTWERSGPDLDLLSIAVEFSSLSNVIVNDSEACVSLQQSLAGSDQCDIRLDLEARRVQ